MVFSPDGKRLYVVGGDDFVSVVDTVSNTVITQVPVGDRTSAVAVTATGTMYVANQCGDVPFGGDGCGLPGNGTLTVVTPMPLAATISVPLGPSPVASPARPTAVGLHPDGGRAYVASQGTNNLAAIDTTTNLVLAFAPVGSDPAGIAVGPACLTAIDCDDGNQCTSDECGGTGVCTHQPIAGCGVTTSSTSSTSSTSVTTSTSTSTSTTIAAMCGDEDADGESDVSDRCPGTDAGEEVDDAGCSVIQFCARFDATTHDGARACRKADWKNDEPLMRRREADCQIESTPGGKRCVPAG